MSLHTRLNNIGLVLTAATGTLLAHGAVAQLTHEITFDEATYPAGSELEGLGGADPGFGTNLWADSTNFVFPPPVGTGSLIEAGSLVDPQGLLQTSGNRRISSPIDDAANPNPLSLSFYSFELGGDPNAKGEPEDALAPGEHWISFLAKTEASAFFGGLSLVKFFGDEILYIGKVGEGGEWGLDQGASGLVAVAGSDSTTDTLLVAKVTIGAGANDDFVDLFINPTLGTLPTTPDIAAYQFNEDPNALNGEGQRIRQIDEIRLGSQNGVFETDEIRIGATFFDVTPLGMLGLEGDYNSDGFVSQGDLDLVLLNWGDAVAPAGFEEDNIPGGGPFDGLMSQNELDGVLLNWGNGTPPLATIPEPTGLALLGLGGLAMLRRRG